MIDLSCLFLHSAVPAAVNMVDHELLLQRLHLSFGLCGAPFHWFNSDRTQMVVQGDNRTPRVRVDLGVPEGSVLCPIYIFSLLQASLLFWLNT